MLDFDSVIVPSPLLFKEQSITHSWEALPAKQVEVNSKSREHSRWITLHKSDRRQLSLAIPTKLVWHRTICCPLDYFLSFTPRI
jgi:hypothetical protein